MEHGPFTMFESLEIFLTTSAVMQDLMGKMQEEHVAVEFERERESVDSPTGMRHKSYSSLFMLTLRREVSITSERPRAMVPGLARVKKLTQRFKPKWNRWVFRPICGIRTNLDIVNLESAW